MKSQTFNSNLTTNLTARGADWSPILFQGALVLPNASQRESHGWLSN